MAPPIALQVKSSGFYVFLIARQYDRVEFSACRSVSCSFAVSTEAEKVTADDVFYVLLRYAFVLRVIDEFAEGLIHRLVSMTTHENIDALKAISSTVVDIVLCLMLHPENIMNLLAGTMATTSNADIYKSTFASVSILDAES